MSARSRLCLVSMLLAWSGCSQQAPRDLSVALKGIEKPRFLSCSGPPLLELPQGGQDRMSFVTNLQRGSTIGIASPTAMAPESCSVNVLFQDNRLVSADFSGNMSMCDMVFSPCLPR
jgi:hypothetical protein